MNADQYIINTIEREVERTARRTFRVWELTALYRTLGLAPREAIAAAVADLRMFPASDYCALQEVAA
jgi:hypothetical protein